MTHSVDVVLDASALICLIRREPGWQAVAAYGNTGELSAVNLVEVAHRLSHHGFPKDQIEPVVIPMVRRVVPLDQELALLTATVHQATRHSGLSLADCACLALGLARNATVVTADRAWSELDLGLKIIQIR